MKKTLLILLIFSLLITPSAFLPISASGTENPAATSQTPEGLPIGDKAGFAGMSANGKYYLTASFSIDDSYANDFRGVLDGQEYTLTTMKPVFKLLNGTVKNLKINAEGTTQTMNLTSVPDDAVDAFGCLAYRAATHRPVEVINVTNNTNMSSTKFRMGGLLGHSGPYKLILKDCVNNGDITGTVSKDITSSYDCGGIIVDYVGSNDTINCLEAINCKNTGNISTYGRPGGIAGLCMTSAKFVNCTNTGNITALNNYGGGICGRISDKNVDPSFLFESCVNNGNIAIFQNNGGGICGYTEKLDRLIFKNCVNTGNVAGLKDITGSGTVSTKEMRLGGFISMTTKRSYDGGTGLSEMVFENCFNFGTIGKENSSGYKYNKCAGFITNILLKGQTGNAKFSGCVNYGNVYVNSADNSNLAAGLVAEVYPRQKLDDKGKNADQKYGTFKIDKCGNTGEIKATGTKTANDAKSSGLVAYCWANKDLGPQITNSFNTGNITGPGLTAGMVAYMNAKNPASPGDRHAKIENCYVAGTIKSTAAAKPKSTGDKVGFRELYSYTGSNNVTRYFLSPSPKKYADAKVTISGDTVTYKKDTNDTEKAVPTFDHGNLLAVALAWSNQGKYTNSNNIIAKGCAGIDYAMGDGTYSVCGGISDESRSSGPEATAFTNGTVRNDLNNGIGNVFYQNLDTGVPVVNTYPTTDRLHITVSLGAGDTVEWQDVGGHPIEGETNAQYKGKAPCENFCHWYVAKAKNKVTCKAVKHGSEGYVGSGEWSAYDETTHTRERQCTKCGGKEKLEFADIVAYNISLKGDIVVNFHAELPASWIDKEDTGYVRYTYKGVTSDPVPVTAYSLGAVLSYPVVAKEMTENVKVELLVKDPGNPEEYITGGSETKCVRDYGEAMINGSDYGPTEKNLAASILNYGAAAQTYFEYNDTDLANKGLSDEYKNMSDSVEITAFNEGAEKKQISVTNSPLDGLAFYSAALNLRTTTSVRFYFNLTSGKITDYTFKYKIKDDTSSDEKPLEPIKRGDKWMVEIPNIYAANLDRKYTLTVSKGGTDMTIEYSPFLYFNRMWEHKDKDQNFKERPLGQAMYGYFDQIKNYQNRPFNSTGSYETTDFTQIITDMYDGNFNVLQGGCTDGTNLYYAIQKQPSEKKNSKDTDKIQRYAYENNKWVKKTTSDELELDHCNDLCYRTGKIYAVRSSVYGDTEGKKTFLNTVARVDAVNLTIDAGFEEIKAPCVIGNLSYNAYRNRFIAGFGCMLYILELDNDAKEFKLVRAIGGYDAGFTGQGIGCDDEYIYVPQLSKNLDKQDHILVYDWHGNYINKIMLPARDNPHYEPENIFFIDGKAYIGFHTAGTLLNAKGTVYTFELSRTNP